MVSFRKDDSVCDTFCKRRLTPPRQTARHRKQRLMSKLGDSGFEDDLVSSPIPPRCRTNASQLESEESESADGQLSHWYLQYGDVGFRIQREKESQFHPCQSLARQPQLTADARCKLVSWLIPVHKHFRLSFECCCLTVNIMDRFLASTPVATDCFQLLGVTALLLASKQVEVHSPSVSYLLSLCCDAFTKEQFCNLECLVLLRLNFRLALPTLAFFLDYFSSLVEAAQFVIKNNSGDGFSGVSSEIAKIRKCSELAQKVCELTLADYAFNKYPPSLIACCALRLACELLRPERCVAEQADVELVENPWECFRGDLCMQPVCIQSCESSAFSPGQCLTGEVTPDQDCSLVQECKDNLKMLVSLNQETLKMRPLM
ncbi:PREDICTED: cyclin-O [Poecilia mexicana]|uniref:cyclin-O n=1 Tax=Poecilia mexicana TaxID=48701 RepID=UPI00072DE2EA|nr:PREDICTED: cyclin-O [Poecilia mexicana]